MAKRVSLTRPELKRQRDMLSRFERYLPMLKLKQQQLQLTLRQIAARRRAILHRVDQARRAFAPYAPILADRAGIDVQGLARPTEIRTSTHNVAGIAIPVFEDAAFPPVTYSLFATPPWVDRALADLRAIHRLQAEADILQQQFTLIETELTKIVQRVNLFEKVMIPQAQEAIRVIRIRLGEEMTAAVGRAKIAKSKLETAARGPAHAVEEAPKGVTHP